MPDKPGEINLRVAEINKASAGRGLCSAGIHVARRLNIKAGEIVEIVGKKSTACIFFPNSEDEGKQIIRIDGLVRLNAGTGLGEIVKVKKAKPEPARRVVVAPINTKVAIQPRKIRDSLMNRPVVKGDNISLMNMTIPTDRPEIESDDDMMENLQNIFRDFGGRRKRTYTLGELRLVVIETQPEDGIVQITPNTNVEVREGTVSVKKGAINYDDVGGLTDVIVRVREMVELPLKHPELFERLGIDPPKGVLLYGPPGCGKTLLAKAVANESDAYFITINGPEIMSKFYGASESRLRKIFKQAQENAPAIIFIDELDSIAPKREDVGGEVERRVVAQLLALMDGLQDRGKVILIGATNRVNSIDPALRRPGRFDREIEIQVPDADGRYEVLQIHTRAMPVDEDVDMKKIAAITHGFVGADIAALCREAAMHSLRAILPKVELDKPIPDEILFELKVTKDDFDTALNNIEASAMREVLIEIPNVKWSEVGGLDSVKRSLIEAVELPLKNPGLFEKAGIREPSGVLLFGPPGCGKTLLAKAVATESEANFITIKGPEVFSKFVGESEKAIREVFRKARTAAPAIIYFDELDAIAPRRGAEFGSQVYENIVNQVLAEMDGIESRRRIVILGATNRPDMIDEALMRPGRFDSLIYVDPPDRETRMQILRIHTKRMPLADDVPAYLEVIANSTEGYSGADLENIAREAGMNAIREKGKDLDKIERVHFEAAFNASFPTLTEELVKSYEKISKKLKKREMKLNLQYMS
ncbi:MAG: CDC48 family AAA ATPase [Candidatus Lokiarchaeota archaeon]|nr:CDC48 family AAA ATPase [Candidatus Lokiarchaeota archaeon]